MFGVVINVISIVLGSCAGLFCKKGIPDKLSDTVMRILGLFVLSVGIVGIYFNVLTFGMFCRYTK